MWLNVHFCGLKLIIIIFTNIIYLLDFDSKAPVSILDFPTYVAHMHQNADFLFSEEFAVSPCFGHGIKVYMICL